MVTHLVSILLRGMSSLLILDVYDAAAHLPEEKEDAGKKKIPSKGK